ncbi:hypothetical protein GCG21_11550 [Pseudactinotalea sp. HY160]|uniref:hypothetical protein n=1 Tax=Pseudactinotalea sp. HY160 TaxID=2654490 RepID=UPI00128BB255|nr:hypothetical protein [Pseudactinotalea sp. HY160]MPV50628.1 hypothetical protein [Pseudactinotalea sp. HY160]
MATYEGAIGVPLRPVFLTGLTVVAAVILTVLGFGTLPWWCSVAGYVFGALLTVGLMSFYRGEKASRRSRRFRPNPMADRVMSCLTVIGVLAGIICAVQVAIEVAKW